VAETCIHDTLQRPALTWLGKNRDDHGNRIPIGNGNRMGISWNGTKFEPIVGTGMRMGQDLDVNGNDLHSHGR